MAEPKLKKLLVKENIKKFSGIAVVLIIFLVSFFITYSGGKDNKLWKDIFEEAGISDVSVKDYSSQMCVHFMSVGKADCSYINCGEYNVLIDAADKEVSANVVEYLKRLNVKKLDLVIATHPHRDHIGQMNKVIEEFKIERFMMPDIPEHSIPTSFTYSSMLKALKYYCVPVETANPGDKIVMGDMIIDVLGPLRASDSLNNNSAVVKITCGDTKFLFMGDAQREEEKDLLDSGFDLSADVLKVGHHGSLTSSTPKFISAVKPKYSVVSVGVDNCKLPKSKLLKRLRDFGSKVLRTDISGNIIFLTDGKNIEVKEERRAS